MVSLDGLKNQHDAHRCFKNGKGSWEQVVENVRLALEIVPQTKVRMSVHADHIQDFFETVKFLFEDLKLREVVFSPVYESNWSPENLKIVEEQFALTVDYQVERMKQGLPAGIKHLNDEAIGNGGPKYNPCGAGTHYMSWSVDGYGFPCHRFNKHGLSAAEKAKSPTCIAIPKGKSFEWINRDFVKQFDFINNPCESCKKCDIWSKSSCNGGCYATNYDLTGDIRKQSKAQCEFTKIQHEAGLLLRAKIDEAGLSLNPQSHKPTGCVCFNMCYAEGTDEEIIHLVRNSDRACICDHANYTGDINAQARPIQNRFADRKILKQFLNLSKRILANPEGDEKQRELSNDILNKTIRMIENARF
jgi:radical SAM protein with 4Fe4S-binding SPASM domain